MNTSRFILASFKYHIRDHILLSCSAALATLIISGALLVGDSVNGTLKQHAIERTGKAEYILFTADRFFTSNLANQFSEKSQRTTSPALILSGSTSLPDQSQRINQIQIVGYSANFFSLASTPYSASKEILINPPLAEQLSLKQGDSLILRIYNPDAMPAEAPLSGNLSTRNVPMRVRVGGITPYRSFGRFSLHASQLARPTIFIPEEMLAKHLNKEDQFNLLLISKEEGINFTLPSMPSCEGLTQKIKNSLSLEDLEFSYTPINKEDKTSSHTHLLSKRIFINSNVEENAQKLGLTPTLSYLATSITSSSNEAPYALVSSADPLYTHFLPKSLKKNEAVLTEWLANDLSVSQGDLITLSYLAPEVGGHLAKRERNFIVRKILPMKTPGMDASWTPDFPGISDSEDCADWDPGIAIDLEKIRNKDEVYWDQYGGTPKLFVHILAGREMWGNRYGNATSWRSTDQNPAPTREQIKEVLIKSTSTQWNLRAFQREALFSTNAPVQFAPLLLAFSFFLVIASFALTFLIFRFFMERTLQENQHLLALGFDKWKVLTIRLLETLPAITIGSFAGTLLGFLYAACILALLHSSWSDATSGAAIEFHYTVTSLGMGFTAGWISSFLPILVSGSTLSLTRPTPHHSFSSKLKSVLIIIGTLTLLAFFAIAFSGNSPESKQGIAFGSGFFLLISLLSYTWLFITRQQPQGFVSRNQLLFSQLHSRSLRSLTSMSILGLGTFMVLSVSVFQKAEPQPPYDNSGPTGGFDLIARSSQPIHYDLTKSNTLKDLGIKDSIAQELIILPARLLPGEDASCLNLNRAIQPQVLGISFSQLSAFNAFSLSDGSTPVSWTFFSGNPSPHVVVDFNTMMWAMQKSVGDTLNYTAPSSPEKSLTISAFTQPSLLQGYVLMDEVEFIQSFPNVSGHQFFLIKTSQCKEALKALTKTFRDYGIEVTPTGEYLQRLNAVENSYLSIFQALGSFGVLLGLTGIALVMGRNLEERVAERALQEAMGWSKGTINQLFFSEHFILGMGGVLIGSLSASWVNHLAQPDQFLSFVTLILGWSLLSVSWLAMSCLAILTFTKYTHNDSLIKRLRHE